MAGQKVYSVNVTRFLAAWNNGDREALGKLMFLVYDELHGIAERLFANERPNHTLQPTALIHEVYLRFAGLRGVVWRNRAHFFGAVAEVMRRILVDHARKIQTSKRDEGEAAKACRDRDFGGTGGERMSQLLALDEALGKLKEMDRRKTRIIMLRYFTGLSVQETAAVLGVSERTVKREWTVAKTWLYRELTPRGANP